jgi:parvulin-like peptidyl-prolyl isomerase
MTPVSASEMNMTPMRRIPKGWLIVGVLVVLLVGLFATNKGFLFAAIVNGKPVFSWELNQTLKARFGAQTLEGIIGERLVFEEAASQGVSVTDEEIEAKRQEVVTSVGGDAQFEDLLKFQGMTRADFEHQVRLQLLVQKLLGKDVAVTEEEVDVYIRDNKATLSATDAAQMRTEARNILLDQKVGEKIQPWFTELKDKASIMRFL